GSEHIVLLAFHGAIFAVVQAGSPQFTRRSWTCNQRETHRRNPVRSTDTALEGTVKQRTPADVLKLLSDEGVEFVDYRFCDLPGLVQHVSVPATQMTEDVFVDGHGFDGSSIRGFQQIQESDMILLPDPNTAYLDPFRARKT